MLGWEKKEVSPEGFEGKEPRGDWVGDMASYVTSRKRKLARAFSALDRIKRMVGRNAPGSQNFGEGPSYLKKGSSPTTWPRGTGSCEKYEGYRKKRKM